MRYIERKRDRTKKEKKRDRTKKEKKRDNKREIERVGNIERDKEIKKSNWKKDIC